jgi:hypothetical protein
MSTLRSECNTFWINGLGIFVLTKLRAKVVLGE